MCPAQTRPATPDVSSRRTQPPTDTPRRSVPSDQLEALTGVDDRPLPAELLLRPRGHRLTDVIGPAQHRLGLGTGDTAGPVRLRAGHEIGQQPHIGRDRIVGTRPLDGLTGAQIVALGKRTAAVLANDDALQGALTQAAADGGESVWPLPIAEEVRSHLDSTVADLKNIGEAGTAGTLAAAAFLREFASPTGEEESGRTQPWGHLDIAGPAFNEGGVWGYTPKGGTGFGVPTLVEFARGYADRD